MAKVVVIVLNGDLSAQVGDLRDAVLSGGSFDFGAGGWASPDGATDVKCGEAFGASGGGHNVVGAIDPT